MKIYKKCVTLLTASVMCMLYMYSFIASSIYALACGILLYAVLVPVLGLFLDQDDGSEFDRFKRQTFYKISKNYRWVITTILLMIGLYIIFEFMNSVKYYVFVTSDINIIDGHIINITFIITKLFLIFYYFVGYETGVICALFNAGRKRVERTYESDGRSKQAS